MKTIKKILFMILFVIFGIVLFADGVYAEDKSYGIYCEYGNYSFTYSGSPYEETPFYFEADSFEGLGIAAESGRPGLPISDKAEQDWLTNNGMLNSKGKLVCPKNPFGSKLGKATKKQCDTGGCKVIDNMESIYDPYTCEYTSPNVNGKLIVKYENQRYTVIYPDGETIWHPESAASYLPNKNCEDIYYIAQDKQIKIAYVNESINLNETYYSLCKIYNDSDILHFCSGNCSVSTIDCSTANAMHNNWVNSTMDNGGCPKMLVPAFKIIKKIMMPIIEFGIPILLILMGSLDMGKAVMASDDKAIKDATSRFIKRCFAAIVIFFAVVIVNILMGAIAKSGVENIPEWTSCWTNLDKND